MASSDTTAGVADFDNANSFNSVLTINKDFANGVTLTAITAYSAFDYDKQIDSDFTINPLLRTTFQEDFNQVSQEVRLDPIFAVAEQVGMKRAEFDACRENQGMIENLKWVKDRGRKLGIVGTPNYFVGDQLIKKELTMADIRAFVEPRIGGVVPVATGSAQ